MTDTLAPGDVVQLLTKHEWAGCLAIVSVVRPWGVVADIFVPIRKDGRGGPRVGLVPLILSADDFARVGRSFPLDLRPVDL